MARSGVASFAAVLLFLAGVASAEPVRVFSANPYYFARDGQPIVFVTSDHHYGAVIDADFDFGCYLDALAAGGMNLLALSRRERPARYRPVSRIEPSPVRIRSGRPPAPSLPRTVFGLIVPVTVTGLSRTMPLSPVWASSSAPRPSGRRTLARGPEFPIVPGPRVEVESGPTPGPHAGV